jgi:hypothetical protein
VISEAVVETIETAQPTPAPEPPVTGRREIWDRLAATNRENKPDTSELFDESDIDIPAFLRQHKKKD